MPRIRICNFKQCSNFHSKGKIFASNENSTDKQNEYQQLDQIENEETNTNQDEQMLSEFNRIVNPYETKSIIPYRSIERFHATVSEIIRANLAEHLEEHPFDILLYAIICHNNSMKKTQGELIFGHKSGRPLETLYNQKNKISKQIAKTKKQQFVFTNMYLKLNLTIKSGTKFMSKESQIKHRAENNTYLKIFLKTQHPFLILTQIKQPNSTLID